MDQPVKVDNPRLQAQRLQRQLAQTERQALEEFGGRGELLFAKLDAMPVARRLMTRQLSLIHCALQQQPGRDLHQPRGQPHAFSRIGESFGPRQRLRVETSVAVEIGGRLLDEAHSLAKQSAKALGSRQSLDERDRLLLPYAAFNSSHTNVHANATRLRHSMA